MKWLATFVAATALLISATGGSLASASQHTRDSLPSSEHHFVLGPAPLRSLPALAKSFMAARWVQAGSSSSDAAQAASPTPTSTSVSQQPDPTPILANRDQVLGALLRAHFSQVSTVEKPQIEKAILTQTGNAGCKGPKVKEHVKATDTIEATGSTTTFKKDYIRVKNNVWSRTDAKHKWAKTKLTKNTQIGLVSDLVSNPLPCGSVASFLQDSSTSQTVTLKDLVNLGPETLGGAAVWHLQATLVASTGETAQADYFVTQAHSLPVKTVITTTSSDGFNIVITVSLSKFDVKVHITAPKTK